MKVSTAVVAAIVGALVGGGMSFLINERNLAKAVEAQNAEFSSLKRHWGEENASKEKQLALMENSIEEMRKTYNFEQDKHRNEMKAIYALITASSENAAALINQRRQLSEVEANRINQEKQEQQEAFVTKAVSDYVAAAELLYASQVSFKRAYCSQVGNDQVVRSSSSGITSTQFFQNEAFDCTAKSAAEKDMITKRAEFNIAKIKALKQAPKNLRNNIKEVHALLYIEPEKIEKISEHDFQQVISPLRAALK